MTKNIIIIGAGGHGAELDDYLQLANRVAGVELFRIKGYLDDNASSFSSYQLNGPLLGRISEHEVDNNCEYLMGIANLTYKQKFVAEFLQKGAKFMTFVHPTAFISASAKIGEGVVIGPMANIGPNAKVGDFTLINSRASLGHDVNVGRFNFISPNVCFSGFTQIGDDNLFGINSATIPRIEIGNRNKIMAGMVIEKNIHDDEIVFYRYKEKIIAVKE